MTGGRICAANAANIVKGHIRTTKAIKTPKLKLFLILWTAGMLGVLSFLTVDLEAVVALLPGASMVELPFRRS